MIISRNPSIRFGDLCVHGTRIPVSTLVTRVLLGETIASVARDYGMKPMTLRAVLREAAPRITIKRWKRDEVSNG